MPRALPLLALTVGFLLAGCTQPYEKRGGDGDGDCTPGVDGCPCPEDTRPGSGGCEPFDSMLLDIQVSASGPYEVGVPFPHGSWCLTGDDWLEGMQETKNLEEHTVRDVDRGKVLWLKGRDDSRYVSRVDLGNRTECQTLRYDPWSIDPDPAEGTVDVTSEQAATFTVYLRTARGACVDLRQYGGEGSGGWITIPETFNGTACP
jgi:hypothetical protein